jgi:hypothetical protein
VKGGKLSSPPHSVAIVANGFQNVISKRGDRAQDQHTGDGVQWNEALQIGVTHMSAPITVSIVDAADAPHEVTATFSVVPSKHNASEEPQPIVVTGEDSKRGGAVLHCLLSFSGLT